MSRPGFLSFVLVQLRPDNFSRNLVPCSCLSSGRDINYSRELFSKTDVATIVPCRDLVPPSLLLHSASQPQFLVATLFLLSPLQF